MKGAVMMVLGAGFVFPVVIVVMHMGRAGMHMLFATQSIGTVRVMVLEA